MSMGELNDGSERLVEVNESSDSYKSKGVHQDAEELTLRAVLRTLIASILSPKPSSTHASRPLLYRVRASLSDNIPLLPQASRNAGRDVLLWTRRGSPFRALLVVSVGTIALLALSGLLVFMLFFLAATFNAIIIALLMSLAAAGGFLAIFFACVTAIYIGAFSVAVLVISTATISAVVAALITTGWVGFFWAVWLAMKKSVGLARHSLTMTGSAVAAYSPGRHACHHQESVKVTD